ncbi:CLUMA_CG020653, isoform A [Clunio marinus]|uniref:CLUMA_CG020653, isoform A n=1 Tax=Clunio marinus TaxID=568069 RepID=A0A1J1J9K7_9DIPT|nr:CLUMA_CG020653, isoform A [Clunio marinus]
MITGLCYITVFYQQDKKRKTAKDQQQQQKETSQNELLSQMMSLYDFEVTFACSLLLSHTTAFV